MFAVIVIIISIFAFVVGFMMARKHFEHRSKRDFEDRMSIEKAMKLERILSYLEKNNKITNNNVEELLGVSDSTATRLLADLEEMDRIEQIGELGRGVYYVSK